MTKLLWEQVPRLDLRLLELNASLEHLANGERHQEIAKVLTEEFSSTVGMRFTADKVRNRLARVRYQEFAQDDPFVLMPRFEHHRAVITGQEEIPAKLVRGKTMDETLVDLRVGRRRILCLSDLHIPFLDYQALDKAIVNNLTADLVIINGDVFDAFSLSTFLRDRDVPIYEELEQTVRFFERISGQYPEAFILVTIGNHEQRVYKRTLPVLPAGLEFLANADLLAILARPFPNIVAIGDWFVQVGSAIFAHSASASSIDARAAVDTLEWFTQHRDVLGLESFNLVVQAHSHRVSVTYRYNGKAIESGCLCLPQSYARTTRTKRPQQQGYVTVYQQNGVSDLVNSREYPIF